VDLPNGKKPEKLIKRLFELFVDSGDIVMDYHLGTGTTCAVAHKMGLQYIGLEQLDYGDDDCTVRLTNVINGEQGGISKARNWKGGGGYKFYELAPSLVVEDKFGNPIINKEYNAEMLSAAMALHEGFTYEPNSNYYWKQGKNENAYIFTTTNHITADYLASISSEMQEGEYLVICCKTFDSGVDKLYKNISIKKIPQVLLGRCEFGKNDYSLNIINVPTVEEDDDDN
jgi:adenine-specific DNA-methyltransferase